MSKLTPLTFTKAFRVDKHTVKVMYRTNNFQDFIVEWSNINLGTGDVERYDLQIDCMSHFVAVNDEVEQAISDCDSDLYLELSETFDSGDCEDI